MIVWSPTAPNSSYEEIDINVFVEYSEPQTINSSVPLLFRYAGNPDIIDITPKKIRNRFGRFLLVIIIIIIIIISVYLWMSNAAIQCNSKLKYYNNIHS